MNDIKEYNDKAFRIENKSGASVTVLSLGAAVQSLCVPDKDGVMTDVVLGYDTLEEYEHNDGNMGAAVGRMANRTGGASFCLNGRTYHLAANDGKNHLHGGLKGFDKCEWSMLVSGNKIACEHVSPDGDEGYPGELKVRITYMLTDDDSLRISYDAESDADTVVNLTNHSYFNLDGSDTILGHLLKINADRICENDPDRLPTGRLLDVAGTPFDFRVEKPIGRDMAADDEELMNAGGYDHNFCVAGKCAAVLYSPKSGIEMEVDTDLPGMQLYTSNFLSPRKGKGGRMMHERSGVCLETQLYPDGMAHYGFPSPVLRKGEKLHTETVLKFRVR